jgi:hypothetical protein
MESFINKHQDHIVGTLSCFDRIIFKGYLPISHEKGCEALFYDQQWLIKQFKYKAPQLSQQIAEHAQNYAALNQRPFMTLPPKTNKEELARDFVRQEGLAPGLIAVFKVLEPCRSFKVIGGKRRPHLKGKARKCNFFYFYFLDREFGLMHVRVQSWLPFPIQIYINGHEWLARKMDRHGIGYTKIDNAFSRIEDLPRAQRFANNLCKKHWPKVLEAFARRVNPHLRTILAGMEHYWCCDQCETAIDLMFKDRVSLKSLYKKLVEHALLCFGAEDVMTFLGKKVHGNFKGERITDLKVRQAGARVKHRIKGNWIKMYDKYGLVLRIETVINQPREFQVFRQGQRKGQIVHGWFPMAKRVTNLPRYFEISVAACRRYLEALSIVDDPRQAYDDLHNLTRSRVRSGRQARGLNPLHLDDAQLFAAVLRGEHVIKGFRNKDIVRVLYRSKPSCSRVAKRRSRKVTRLLGILWTHGLVAKIPRSRRWRVTDKGRRLMSGTVVLRNQDIPERLVG